MVGLGVLTQVGVAGKDFPASCAGKFMNISNMILTVCLLYKMLFALRTPNPLVPSVYMHVTLGYIITVFALHLAILAISFQCRWILGYLILSHNWLGCDRGVFKFHVPHLPGTADTPCTCYVVNLNAYQSPKGM